MSNYTYFTIAKEGVSDFRDRGSKFFGYAFPISTVEEAKAKLQQLKNKLITTVNWQQMVI
jgi:putative IMPACT (imprinted ancient) family translation regulator